MNRKKRIATLREIIWPALLITGAFYIYNALSYQRKLIWVWLFALTAGLGNIVRAFEKYYELQEIDHSDLKNRELLNKSEKELKYIVAGAALLTLAGILGFVFDFFIIPNR